MANVSYVRLIKNRANINQETIRGALRIILFTNQSAIFLI
jgi:hypothetical protein